MQVTIPFFCMVLALVLLLLAGLNVPGHPRVNFGWLGLFFWLLSIMLH